MKLEYLAQDELKKMIKKAVAKYLPLSSYRLFFFGSRISGKASERSDIDIGIEGKKPVSSEVISRIKEEFEALPTLYTIDFVDFSQTEKDFKKVAKKHIELIN